MEITSSLKFLRLKRKSRKASVGKTFSSRFQTSPTWLPPEHPWNFSNLQPCFSLHPYRHLSIPKFQDCSLTTGPLYSLSPLNNTSLGRSSYPGSLPWCLGSGYSGACSSSSISPYHNMCVCRNCLFCFLNFPLDKAQ